MEKCHTDDQQLPTCGQLKKTNRIKQKQTESNKNNHNKWANPLEHQQRGKGLQTTA